jgi:hypothetical protein
MAGTMQVEEIRPGLWRWTAPHPEWTPEKDRPGGWGRMVGCVQYEQPGAGALVLIDPLLPAAGSDDAGRFWSALDKDVERTGLPVAVLLANHYHERSAQAIYERYRFGNGASVWASHHSIGRVNTPLTRVFRTDDLLPAGVVAQPIVGLADTETAFYLPPHRALVFADAVLGAGGGALRVAPASWADAGPEAAERYKREFRPSLRRLLDLEVDMVLVGHGDCALSNGRRALAEALEAPAWGDA